MTFVRLVLNLRSTALPSAFLKREWAGHDYSLTVPNNVHSASGRIQEIAETSKTTKNHFCQCCARCTDRDAASNDFGTAHPDGSPLSRPIVQHLRRSGVRARDRAEIQ